MARVEFRTAAVRQHGFPQACVTCGNDEDNQLVSHPAGSKTPWGGCLFMLFGPIGWILTIIVFAKYSKKSELRLPVCKLCKKGLSHVQKRFALISALAMTCLFAQVWEQVPRSDGWFWAALLLFGYAVVEYCWLSPQFLIKVVKMNDDMVVVQVPNDDYPGLYERHLDNALLYGSSETMGARADLD